LIAGLLLSKSRQKHRLEAATVADTTRPSWNARTQSIKHRCPNSRASSRFYS